MRAHWISLGASHISALCTRCSAINSNSPQSFGDIGTPWSSSNHSVHSHSRRHDGTQPVVVVGIYVAVVGCLGVALVVSLVVTSMASRVVLSAVVLSKIGGSELGLVVVG